MPRYRLPIALLALGLCAALGRADNWPAWRGPTGQGHSAEKNLPLKWSATENVRWKVALENPGQSTPVVWGDRVFVTQAAKGGGVRSLICFARADGKLLWQKDVAYSEKEQNWKDFPYANASPATDGERVVACFGSAGLFCYDLAGKELWKRTDLGKWEANFGNSASPVLHGDLVVQWCGPNDGNGRNYLLAVEKKTGKTAWERDEPYASWSTPLVVNVKGQDQIVVGHSKDVKNKSQDEWGYLKGFDPKTGKEVWKCQGLSSYQYTSPLYADGVAVAMSGYGGSALAVQLGGAGDITKDRLWLHPTPATQRVGSGVIVGGHVYMIDENAVQHCYELKTGKDLWADEPRAKGLRTWGSTVHAGGRLYTLMGDGSTLVLAANPKYEVLARNTLAPNEQTNSSLAVSDGDIFIRTHKHLWCISEKK